MCMWIGVELMVYHAHLSCCSALNPSDMPLRAVSSVFIWTVLFSLAFMCTFIVMPGAQYCPVVQWWSSGYYTTQDVVCQPLLWTVRVAAFWRKSHITITEILLTLTAFSSSLRALAWSYLGLLLQLTIWPVRMGWKTGLGECWVLNSEWPFYLGQRPLWQVGGGGTCWFGWWPP